MTWRASCPNPEPGPSPNPDPTPTLPLTPTPTSTPPSPVPTLVLTLTLTATPSEQASQLHCALLRILIPDYDGVDGGDKWVKALRDPLLPLSWPRHLHMYPQAG